MYAGIGYNPYDTHRATPIGDGQDNKLDCSTIAWSTMSREIVDFIAAATAAGCTVPPWPTPIPVSPFPVPPEIDDTGLTPSPPGSFNPDEPSTVHQRRPDGDPDLPQWFDLLGDHRGRCHLQPADGPSRRPVVGRLHQRLDLFLPAFGCAGRSSLHDDPKRHRALRPRAHTMRLAGRMPPGRPPTHRAGHRAGFGRTDTPA